MQANKIMFALFIISNFVLKELLGLELILRLILRMIQANLLTGSTHRKTYLIKHLRAGIQVSHPEEGKGVLTLRAKQVDGMTMNAKINLDTFVNSKKIFKFCILFSRLLVTSHSFEIEISKPKCITVGIQ